MIDDIISKDLETIKSFVKVDAFERVLVTGGAGLYWKLALRCLVGFGANVTTLMTCQLEESKTSII